MSVNGECHTGSPCDRGTVTRQLGGDLDRVVRKSHSEEMICEMRPDNQEGASGGKI